MRFAKPGGRIEHISSMPGLRNSVTVNGSPGFTPISAAMRASRAGAILAWATRITSSYDMRTARWRAVSRRSRPPAPQRSSAARIGASRSR